MTVDPMVRARPFCPGCGYHYALQGTHRADCTTDDTTRWQLFFTPRRNVQTSALSRPRPAEPHAGVRFRSPEGIAP